MTAREPIKIWQSAKKRANNKSGSVKCRKMHAAPTRRKKKKKGRQRKRKPKYFDIRFATKIGVRKESTVAAD